MFRSDLSDQRQLFAFTPRDLVPEDSDVWLYIDIFDSLDVSSFRRDYSSQGEQAIDPLLMLRTLFYGLTHGVVTGRKLEDACRFDNRFVVLSGQQAPSYRTFSRFIDRHKDRFSLFFAQVVKLAQGMGLLSLGRVAIDGSRMKANTSRAKAMSYERMIKATREIETQLEALRADLARENAGEQSASSLVGEIARREVRLAKIKSAKEALEREAVGEVVDPKAQKSFADHDALPMYKPKDGFQYGYNCQAVVDEKSQIIVAAEVHGALHDSGALASSLAATKQTVHDPIDEVLADNGYLSGANLQTIAAAGMRAVIALGRGEVASSGDKYHLHDLRVHASGHRCRRGRVLPRRQQFSTGHIRLKIPKKNCVGCPLKSGCGLYKKRGREVTLMPEMQRRLYRTLEKVMQSERGKESYRRRKAIVEPVFGNIKNKGLKIRVRGASKVANWWKIAATAHNLEKVVGARRLIRV